MYNYTNSTIIKDDNKNLKDEILSLGILFFFIILFIVVVSAKDEYKNINICCWPCKCIFDFIVGFASFFYYIFDKIYKKISNLCSILYDNFIKIKHKLSCCNTTVFIFLNTHAPPKAKNVTENLDESILHNNCIIEFINNANTNRNITICTNLENIAVNEIQIAEAI